MANVHRPADFHKDKIKPVSETHFTASTAKLPIPEWYTHGLLVFTGVGWCPSVSVNCGWQPLPVKESYISTPCLLLFLINFQVQWYIFLRLWTWPCRTTLSLRVDCCKGSGDGVSIAIGWQCQWVAENNITNNQCWSSLYNPRCMCCKATELSYLICVVACLAKSRHARTTNFETPMYWLWLQTQFGAPIIQNLLLFQTPIH